MTETFPSLLNGMKKISAILMATLLISSCGQYETGKFICKGRLYINNVYPDSTSSFVEQTDQVIAMHIDSSKVDFSGNNLLLGNQIKICKIGEIEFSKKDEMYFDNSGCKTVITNPKNETRKYGTYNFITNELTLTNMLQNDLSMVRGTFTCEEKK